MSKITNDRLNPIWHRMLYSCTHMVTVSVKGLKALFRFYRYLVVQIKYGLKQESQLSQKDRASAETVDF